MGESKLIDHYTLSDNMYGRDTWPAKGKIELRENTSQKDLAYLYNDVGMVNHITKSKLSKKQIDILEDKKAKRAKQNDESQKNVAKVEGKVKKDK